MRERPSLFNGATVRVILAGKKTQTRRAVKLPHNNPLGQWEASTSGGYGARDGKGKLVPEHVCIWHTRTGEAFSCPFGEPGDRLWVRERFKPVASGQVKNGYGEVRYGYSYEADSTTRWNKRTTIIHDLTGQPGKGPMQFQQTPWRSSICMPHRACRLVLEITAVRVERLQAISDPDALAEGIEELNGRYTHNGGSYECRTPVGAFHELWTTTGGDWDSNPWVWVIEFKRVEDR